MGKLHDYELVHQNDDESAIYRAERRRQFCLDAPQFKLVDTYSVGDHGSLTAASTSTDPSGNQNGTALPTDKTDNDWAVSSMGHPCHL